jgi:hypothetical protein
MLFRLQTNDRFKLDQPVFDVLHKLLHHAPEVEQVTAFPPIHELLLLRRAFGWKVNDRLA